MDRGRIRRAHSSAGDAREAAREFHDSVIQPDMSLVVFFASADYDLGVLAEELRLLFEGIQLVGCTTAGEIGPAGYRDRSISGASFPRGAFAAASGYIGQLQRFEIKGGYEFAQRLLQELERQSPSADEKNSFGLLLIDGLSKREEPVTRALQDALGRLPLVGGSAGDGLRFERTFVYLDGQFHQDSAILTLISTSLPFRLFKTQHFVATDERLVVTEADTSARLVREINGLPAAEEYARIAGIEANDLNPARFAATPVVVTIDGANYVRAIQKSNPDGSLTFFCAIEEGVVLRVAKGVDLSQSTEEVFDRLREEMGPPQLVLACDCILRKIAAEKGADADRISRLLQKNNVVGFNTYGEQFRGVHINQTLVGVAIGEPPAARPHA